MKLRRNKVVTVSTASTLAAILILSGCSEGADAPETDDTQTTTTSEETKTETPEETPEPEPSGTTSELPLSDTLNASFVIPEGWEIAPAIPGLEEMMLESSPDAADIIGSVLVIAPVGSESPMMDGFLVIGGYQSYDGQSVTPEDADGQVTEDMVKLFAGGGEVELVAEGTLNGVDKSKIFKIDMSEETGEGYLYTLLGFGEEGIPLAYAVPMNFEEDNTVVIEDLLKSISLE